MIVLKATARPDHQTTITAEEAELTTDWADPRRRCCGCVCSNFRVEIEGTAVLFQSGHRVIRRPDRRASSRPAPPRLGRHARHSQIDRGASGRDQGYYETADDLLSLRENYRKAGKVLGLPEPHDNLNGLNDAITERQNRIFRLKTEPYRRWSNGFTCLCFSLIGIPVAMLWRHADGLTIFSVFSADPGAILPIADAERRSYDLRHVAPDLLLDEQCRAGEPRGRPAAVDQPALELAPLFRQAGEGPRVQAA